MTNTLHSPHFQHPLPSKGPREHTCASPWYANCPDCSAHEHDWLARVREWAQTAYDPHTTGLLWVGRQDERWSRHHRRFVWRDPQVWGEKVTGYNVRANGDVAFHPLNRRVEIWSRMGQGDAGYNLLLPDERECVLPIKRGVRNERGYISRRYTQCDFVALADMTDAERERFEVIGHFGTSRDWNRAYND